GKRRQVWPMISRMSGRDIACVLRRRSPSGGRSRRRRGAVMSGLLDLASVSRPAFPGWSKRDLKTRWGRGGGDKEFINAEACVQPRQIPDLYEIPISLP